MKGQQLQVVDKFIYLGSTLSRVVHIDDEVNARVAKASAAFGRLRLFVLRFYGPVNPVGSCRAQSVYLTTLLLGRLSPLSG